MNRLVKFAMFSSAIVAAQIASTTAAYAQSEPDGVLIGAVVATKGIVLNCDLVLTLDAAANTADIDLNPGDPNCAALVFNNEPYATTYANGVLTVLDVDVTTITLGDCAGDISASWDGSTLTIDTTLPAKTAGPPCTIVGSAS